MACEIERKYLEVDFDELRAKLESVGASPAGGPHFESNLVFDTAGGTLAGAKKLLRLRTREWPDHKDVRLTFKRPLEEILVAGRPVKCRDETEIGVDSAQGMQAILLGLGFRVAARYEKIRETYLCQGAHVEMDLLPFGNVVEIEGSVELIAHLESLLGLDKVPTSAKSYFMLYQDSLKEEKRDVQKSFVFLPDARIRLRARLGLTE